MTVRRHGLFLFGGVYESTEGNQGNQENHPISIEAIYWDTSEQNKHDREWPFRTKGG